MRRHFQHVIALLAYAAGHLAADGAENLPSALPLAACVFIVVGIIPEIELKLPDEFDSHAIKVAALTSLLWIPVLAFYLPLIIPPSGLSVCTFDSP